MKTSQYPKNLLVAAITISITSHCFAEEVAELTLVGGKVLVNNGTKYAMAMPGTPLRTGTKIVAPKGSTFSMVYKDGCIKQVKENSVITVGPASECSTRKFNERVYYAEAPGGTTTDAAPSGLGSDSPGIGGGGSGGLGGGSLLPLAGAGGLRGALFALNDNEQSCGGNSGAGVQVQSLPCRQQNISAE